MSLRIIGQYGHVDLSQRNFDIAIEFRENELPGLCGEALMEEYLLPVCSPEYLAQHRFLQTPSGLARCTLLHDADPWEFASEDAEWRYWLDQMAVHDVDSSQGQFFTLSNMAVEAALTDQGVALGRASLIKDLLESERLVMPFQGCVRSPCHYSLAYPRELADRPCMRTVLEWLREEAAKMSRTASQLNIVR